MEISFVRATGVTLSLDEVELGAILAATKRCAEMRKISFDEAFLLFRSFRMIAVGQARVTFWISKGKKEFGEVSVCQASGPGSSWSDGPV